jgi:tryptophan synthase alpha chain
MLRLERMNRIDAMFQAKRQTGSKALILYLTAGFPDLETTERLVPALEESGCDLLELGIPFSDPLADGPTIQQASFEALQAGASLAKILDMVERLRSRVKMPMILFSAYNPLLRFGLDRLVKRCVEIGIDGYLVADLPLEESYAFRQRVREVDQHLIYLTAPTTPDDRKIKYARKASGFLYHISVAGVTGARETVADDLAAQIAPYREASDIPVAVGFGISRPEHVAQVAQVADAAVVGSQLINVVMKHRAEGAEGIERAVREFVLGLAEPLRMPTPR